MASGIDLMRRKGSLRLMIRKTMPPARMVVHAVARAIKMYPRLFKFQVMAMS